MQSRQILREAKGNKQGVALEEVSTAAEFFKEVDKSHEECKGVGINKLEVLPSMEDNHHYGMIIRHDFENSFMWKESAREKRFNFFKFISLTIGMWVQRVLQGMQISSPLVL